MKKPRLLLLLPIVWMAMLAQSQQLPVVLSGAVIESATGRPLPRVSLELRPFEVQQPGARGLPPSAPVVGARYPGLTNDNGQFVFRNIPPGRYTLTASRNGYVHADYGQRGPNGKSVPLTVTAGQPISGIQLFISRAAAISGHIYDSTGAPFPYMQVNARRVTYTGGQRTLTITGATYTDDLGEYRIYGLPPGTYLLSAEGETSSQGILPVAAGLTPPLPGSVVIQGIGGSMLYTPDPANQRKPNQRAVPKAPTYFRTATNDRDAWPIELLAGDDLKGTDITYVASPTIPTTFSGLGGLPNVSLGILPLQMRFGNASQSGEIIAPLPPGSYTAVAIGNDNARRTLMGIAAFDVNPANPPNVKVALRLPVLISGRVVLQGRPEGAADSDLARASIRFRRSPPMTGLQADAASPVSAAGTFAAQIAIDGEYRIEITGLPTSLADRYLKSANSIRVAGQPVNDLQIVLGARAGQIDGTAVDEKGSALSNVTVVLVPEQRNRTDLYKSQATDAAGRFRFDGIAPGNYLLFSWEDVEPDAWFNPEFLRAIEDRGKPMVILEGSRERLDVPAIPMR